MCYDTKILYLIDQYPDRQILQSKLIALLYIIDEELDETTHYTTDNEYPLHISSNKIIDTISKLAERNLLNIVEKPTYGGDIRVYYELTQDGHNTVDKDELSGDYLTIAQEVYKEYNTYPISNLLKHISENYYL